MRHFAERAYLAQKKRPDPFLEFALTWLARHEPGNPGREAVIVWDAGQFHQRGGRITALLDLEFGHIGDPLADLAGLWVRNPFIPLGDVAALMLGYAECGPGVPGRHRGRPLALRPVVAVQPVEFHAAPLPTRPPALTTC